MAALSAMTHRPAVPLRAVVWVLILIALNACTFQFGLERPTDSAPVANPTRSPAPVEASSTPETPTPVTDTPLTDSTAEESQAVSPTETASPVPPAAAAPTSTPTASAVPEVACAESWFFEVPAHLVGHCPQPVVVSQAAAQSFEHGRMIWTAQPGRFYILSDQVLFEGELRKSVSIINDPLDVTGDTSADYTPPAGLIAPTSGFGLVWRGDVSHSGGFQDQIGWATAPEMAYEARTQCEIGSVSGGRSWRFCFLLAPDGSLIVLHALDGWLWLSEWEG